jgi:hypothetical protein
MALLQINTNLEQAINQLDSRVKLLTDRNLRYMAARAMTRSAQAAQSRLKQDMPRFIDQPTPFTLNSTFVRYAKPADLTVEVGFKQFASKGTPAGRYLQPMAGGGGRPLKSSERQLQSRGLLPAGRYLVPTGVSPLRLNQYGNLSASSYTQVISRLGGFGEQGYTANVSRSAASQAKRRQRDYFIGRPGGLPLGVYARVGKRPKSGGLPRGFHTVFYVTRQPSYRASFPISQLLSDAYGQAWPIELRAAFQAELAARLGGRP